MKYIKKIAVLFIAAGVSIGAFASCSNKEGITRVVFTTGPGKDEIFRIEDEICTRPEIMVYLTNTQNQYENVYGQEIWQTSLEGVSLEENVKETVLEKAAQVKTMYLLAKEKEIVLEEEDKERITTAAQEYFLSLNETEVEQMGVTQETIEQLYTEYVMADKVYLHIIQDINPEISDDEARIITVQHILIRTYKKDANGNRVDFTERQKQEAYDKISGIRDLATDGEHDFTELASHYSEDVNLTYSFGKGDMDAAFEDAAFKLETDEISNVVESESGYHIIKCLNTFNREETDTNKLKILKERRGEVFGQEYDKFVEGLAKRLNQKLWDEISLIHDSKVTTADFYTVYEKYFVRE